MSTTGSGRRTALVTGASSGIGRELAALLARDGHDLVLAARRREQLVELADNLRRVYRVDARAIAVDLASPTGSGELVEALAQDGVTVDVLVNNAGFATWGAFAETSTGVELEMLRLNVLALTELTSLLLPRMIERRYGRILNVASIAAFQPGPFMAVYYASKAYVLSLSEAIAEELAGSGVTVTALCPGPTATGFADRAGLGGTRTFDGRRTMDAAEVAAVGYAAMVAGRRLVVPGLRNRVLAQSVRFAPRRLTTRIVRRAQGPDG